MKKLNKKAATRRRVLTIKDVCIHDDYCKVSYVTPQKGEFSVDKTGDVTVTPNGEKTILSRDKIKGIKCRPGKSKFHLYIELNGEGAGIRTHQVGTAKSPHIVEALLSLNEIYWKAE